VLVLVKGDMPAKKVKKSALKAKASPTASPKEAPAGSPKVSPKTAPSSPKVSPDDKAKLAAQAVEDILKGVSQPDAQKTGCFIPNNWHTKYKTALGAYKKFVKSSEKLQVVERENGNFVIMRAGDKSEPPAGQTATGKGSDWKKLLVNAWNIYCKATPKHEWSMDVFTSALPKGPRSAKAEGAASPKATPKASPKAAPKASPKTSPKVAPAAAEAEATKKTRKKKGKK